MRGLWVAGEALPRPGPETALKRVELFHLVQEELQPLRLQMEEMQAQVGQLQAQVGRLQRENDEQQRKQEKMKEVVKNMEKCWNLVLEMFRI